jgi:DNA-binding NtrC family response regulator
MSQKHPSQKILIIDDNRQVLATFQKGLKDTAITVLFADSFDKARKIYADNKDVGMIFVGLCSEGFRLRLDTLVRELRAAFAGPMIAVAKHWGERELLKDAGCNEEYDNIEGLPTLALNFFSA